MHIDIQTASHPALNFYLDRASWQEKKKSGKTQMYSNPISEPLKGLEHLLQKKQRMKDETDKADKTKSLKNGEKEVPRYPKTNCTWAW